MTATTISISGPSSSHARPPHWKNWASVSMSLVTRATSAPRRSSLWSARLIRWMCEMSRVPQLVERLLGALTEPDDGLALGDAGDHQRDGADRRQHRRRARPARRRS